MVRVVKYHLPTAGGSTLFNSSLHEQVFLGKFSFDQYRYYSQHLVRCTHAGQIILVKLKHVKEKLARVNLALQINCLFCLPEYR